MACARRFPDRLRRSSVRAASRVPSSLVAYRRRASDLARHRDRARLGELDARRRSPSRRAARIARCPSSSRRSRMRVSSPSKGAIGSRRLPVLDLLLGAVAVAVALGMAANAVGLAFDQRRALAAPGARRSPRRTASATSRRCVAVDDDARHAYRRRRGRRRCSTAVERSVDIDMPYLLFSQTKITGSFQIEAMLSASWKAPSLVAPSPKKQTATLSRLLHLGWRAPRRRRSECRRRRCRWRRDCPCDIGDVHRAAAAAAIAVFLAEELGEHALRIGALGDAVAVAAMRRGDLVVVAQVGMQMPTALASWPIDRCMVPWIRPRV